jgi:hypothetical protein
VFSAVRLDVGPDTADYNGNTLPVVAAQNNNRKVLKLLLRRAASLDVQNTKGNAALHYALAYRLDALAERVRQIPVVRQSGRLLVWSAGRQGLPRCGPGAAQPRRRDRAGVRAQAASARCVACYRDCALPADGVVVGMVVVPWCCKFPRTQRNGAADARGSTSSGIGRAGRPRSVLHVLYRSTSSEACGIPELLGGPQWVEFKQHTLRRYYREWLLFFQRRPSKVPGHAARGVWTELREPSDH